MVSILVGDNWYWKKTNLKTRKGDRECEHMRERERVCVSVCDERAVRESLVEKVVFE